MYAIVDIETTGGSPTKEKITEIAIYAYDGEKVVDEFTTLVNPQCTIPYYITKLTGITNEMVADAPKFYEVARRIVEITEDRIFVAHNVAFDFNFVQNEFKMLGYNFYRQVLDTVRLSRKLLPGHSSYGLGKLCKDLNIEIHNRHRASGDALATVQLFELLLKKNAKNQRSLNEVCDETAKGTHTKFDRSILQEIPQAPGVYYFFNEHDDIIYIGKSINLSQRILSHFNNRKSKRAINMKAAIVRISWQLTGSEIVALVLESAEIKKHRPHYNRHQRRSMNHFGIFPYMNEQGYLCFTIATTKNMCDQPITCFNNKNQAITHLKKVSKLYGLCQKLSGVYDYNGACFYHQLGECKGACIGKEPANLYNLRAEQAAAHYQYDHHNFIIMEPGRDCSEQSFIRVANGKYEGFGFVPENSQFITPEDFDDYITFQEDNHEIQRILTRYLKKHNVQKTIRF